MKDETEKIITLSIILAISALLNIYLLLKKPEIKEVPISNRVVECLSKGGDVYSYEFNRNYNTPEKYTENCQRLHNEFGM